MKRIELYSLYERIWHWFQALAIIALSATGFEIHAPQTLRIFGFSTATRLHEALALFTIANGFLSLFYHLATGAIRQFVPEPKDLLSLGFVQIRYYVYGIFRGDPHPFVRQAGNKLNLLQQVTYLGILNVLLPLQLASGVLMWRAGNWPRLINSLGGLRSVATLHVAVAWLFVAFVIMHVYLTTTGHTPLSHIRAMIVGHETSEADHETS